MRTRSVRRAANIFVLLIATFGYAQMAKTPLKVPAHPNPNLYPANANANQEVKEAVAAAGREHKRVLLVFGANWCLDCHALDSGFHQPRIAPLLNGNFKVVHVDIGRGEKNVDLVKKYHIPLEKGIPSLAVLNEHGGLLYSSAEFESARAMTEEDVIAFLNTWKPRADAKR